MLLAIAALVTAVGTQAWNVAAHRRCKRSLAEARAELDRLAGDLSVFDVNLRAFEKAAEESGVFNVAQTRPRRR